MNVLSTTICVRMVAVLTPTQKMVSAVNVMMVSCITLSARDVMVAIYFVLHIAL